jgi:uncharacterized membrane protein
LSFGKANRELQHNLEIFKYALSFIYVGIYWNNHHHMLQACQKVTGPILWANLHLLFWLSMFPFATGCHPLRRGSKCLQSPRY